MIPDEVKENLPRLFIGILTVLVIAIPLSLYIYFNRTKTDPKPAPKTTIEQSKNTISYTNPTHLYSLSYPLSWIVTPGNTTALYSDELFYPKEEANGSPTIGIRTFVSIGPEWSSPKAYFNYLQNLPMNQYYPSNGRLTKLANVKVDDTPAVMVIEESTDENGASYFSKNVYVYQNNILYVLMNSAESEVKEKVREDIFNQIIASFRFGN
ncbi:MAG: PsbP-related protein [Patescibacteria group bacterium]|mgnify:FL=1